MSRIDLRKGLAHYPRHRVALDRWMEMVEATRAGFQALGPIETEIRIAPGEWLDFTFRLGPHSTVCMLPLGKECLPEAELAAGVIAALTTSFERLLYAVASDPACAAEIRRRTAEPKPRHDRRDTL